MFDSLKYNCYIFSLTTILSCSSQEKITSDPIENVVGEIFYDGMLDSSNFKICNNQNQIIQYYAFNEKTFEGDKAAIIQHFYKQYKVPENNLESGYIRVRFIVNCKGKSGRFRLLESDLEYNPKTFSKDVSHQVLKITKSLNSWKSMTARGVSHDYYQYLIFKIINGQIIDILP